MRLFAAFLFLVGCLSLPATGSAQPLTVDWGIKAGVNSADIQSNTVGGGERRRAFVGGGFLELDFIGSFALQADLLYSQKGDENEVGAGTDRTLFRVKLDYVEVPVMLKLQGPLLGGAEANFYAGPSVAFKVNESVEGLAPGTLVTGTLAKSTDIGAALGIEFVFGLGGPQFVVDLRFTPGFSSIRDDAVIRTERDSFEIPDPEATNTTFSVMAGISL